MTIIKKFNKLFEPDYFLGADKKEEIAEFFIKEIKSLIKEMIGEKRKCDCWERLGIECGCSDYNEKRKELIELAKSNICSLKE